MKLSFTTTLVLCNLVFLLVGCQQVPTIIPATSTSGVTPIATITSLPTVMPTETETPIPTDTPIPPITVLITSLSEGTKIPRTIDISGEYQNIPIDRELWLYVYATSIEQYFLLPVDRFSNGRWQVIKVIVGAEGETGTKYKIGVIAVDLADNERLKRRAQGLTETDLPASTQRLIEIIVYRE